MKQKEKQVIDLLIKNIKNLKKIWICKLYFVSL
jgi:hypothetical protein